MTEITLKSNIKNINVNTEHSEEIFKQINKVFSLDNAIDSSCKDHTHEQQSCYLCTFFFK